MAEPLDIGDATDAEADRAGVRYMLDSGAGFVVVGYRREGEVFTKILSRGLEGYTTDEELCNWLSKAEAEPSEGQEDG